MKDFAKLGFERSEGRRCQKILVFALNILKPAATRIESDLRVNSSVRALGKESSSRMLSPRSPHTKKPRLLVLPAENEQRKNNDKRFVPKTRDLSLEISSHLLFCYKSLIFVATSLRRREIATMLSSV